MKKAAVDEKRVARFASFLRGLSGVEPFDFCSRDEGAIYPFRGRPGVVEYFFFCCAHQFGFWHLEEGRYARPMIARIDGVELKGSDYLWRCATRVWTKRPGFFAPTSLAEVTEEEWNKVFGNDGGVNPLPMWEKHLEITRGYARWFLEREQTPEKIVARANRGRRVLRDFLEIAGGIPGYVEDQLRKKLYLLAITLWNRPEGFLKINDPEQLGPVIDYHLQRSALRTGLVEVGDPDLRGKLIRRETVSEEQEEIVRRAVYRAVERLIAASGVDAAAVDYFFFTNRRRCPEMTEPECPACPVRPVCARRTELFQPVFRTTAY